MDKYLNLIDCNIPILIQTRDPISLLKHSYGIDWSKVQRNYNQNFNLNFNYQEYINFLKPNKTYMKDDFENLLENTFIMHILLNKINANNITYIDMCNLDEKKLMIPLLIWQINLILPPPIMMKIFLKEKNLEVI